MPFYKKERKVKSNAITNTNAELPRWPSLTLLRPTGHPEVNVVYSNQIIIIPQLWTAELSAVYVSFLSTLPFMTTPAKPKNGEAVRVNDRFRVQDAAFAESLWRSTFLKDIILGNIICPGLDITDIDRKNLWKGEVVRSILSCRSYLKLHLTHA